MILGQSIFKLLLNPSMIALVIASMIAVVVIIERIINYRKMLSVGETDFLEEVKRELKNGEQSRAKYICRQLNTPLSKVIGVIMENLHLSTQGLNETAESALSLTRLELRKRLNVLWTISYIAPLLGLLGTILGIIQAFYAAGREGAVRGPEAIMEGVALALVTTAVGIIVAVPTAIMYNVFEGRVKNLYTVIEAKTQQFLTYLCEERER
jgi:biopolymer transport protein ExbB